MPKYVGLLRGVNVGGKNKMPMNELRALFESLGHTQVSTFIQSGNVLFTSSTRVAPVSLESAIAEQLGVNTTVVLRTPRELRTIVEQNPFPGCDVSKLHVGFLTHKPSAGALATIDAKTFAPEELVVRNTEMYLYLPNGMGRAKLPARLESRVDVPATMRNWNTVVKLLELAAG